MKNAAKTLGLGLEEESSFDRRIVLQFGELYFDFSGFIKIVHGIVLRCILRSKHDFNEVAPDTSADDAALSLFLLPLLGRPLLLLHLPDQGGVPLVLFALGVQVVEVERVDDVLLLEQELLHLAIENCRDAASLFAVLSRENILDFHSHSLHAGVV